MTAERESMNEKGMCVYICWSSVSKSKDSLEGLSELWVEYGVDERVNTGIDVSQPRGDNESCVSRQPAQVKLDADCIDDVACEERDPAD